MVVRLTSGADFPAGAGDGAGFAVMSTTGAGRFAAGVVAGRGPEAAGAGAGGAACVVERVAVTCVVMRFGEGAGLAVATCAAFLTVCLVTVLVDVVAVSAAGSVLVSTVEGAVCSTAGAGVGVAGGAASVVTGGACCAVILVGESARAAAIAGRALARTYLFTFLMMRRNRYGGSNVASLSPARTVTSTD